jgi:hypothetical protein
MSEATPLPTVDALADNDTTSVIIATPMMDMCHTVYCSALIQLFAYTLMQGRESLSVGFLQYGCSVLPFSRQLLATRALEADADWMLWIDSDMDFPPDMMLRFLSVANPYNRPVVAANCMARRAPFTMTARDKDGEQVFTRADSTGLEEVTSAGFGVVFVHTSVFRKLPLPWFQMTWQPEKAVFRGEDFHFFDKCNEAGIPVYIDHDISKDVKHVGTFAYHPLLMAQPTGETNEDPNTTR